jgi:hypothetical protein
MDVKDLSKENGRLFGDFLPAIDCRHSQSILSAGNNNALPCQWVHKKKIVSWSTPFLLPDLFYQNLKTNANETAKIQQSRPKTNIGMFPV